TQSITLNLLIGIIILFLSVILSNYIFRIFDVSQEVYNNSVLYFKIILVGIIPMFISFAFSAILRGAGDTVTPMRITAIANILNIIGNYVLIKGVGPFPELGIAGAAWSTTISRFIALLLYIYKIYIKDSSIKLKPSLFLSKKIVKPLWEISLPGGIEQGLMQLSFVVLGVIVSKLDTISEATFRILIQIESLSFMPAVGMSIAAATLVGQSLGEKNENKAVEIGYLSSFLGILWGIFIGLLFILFPSSAIVVFSKESSILETGIGVMLFMGINQLGLNFVIVMSGALRGAGDTKFVMIVTVLRLWLIFIPLSYLFINRMNLGLAGVWYAEIISFIVFSTQFFFRFKSRKWVKDI
ncbi:MAG: MATE family efflux transporter, partial [Spirochaetales bacterium]|nr:MATE family efflux transporter [Spirochaetales bacterium]